MSKNKLLSGKKTKNNCLCDWQKLDTFLKNNSEFSEQQMRWLLYNRHNNGLEEHVRKIGRPIYIHAPGFLKWIFNREER